MVPHPETSVKEGPARSWSWTAEHPFQARTFYQRGWEVLRQDRLVFLWKLAADLVARGAIFLLGMVLLTLFLVDLELFKGAGNSLWFWPAHILEVLSSPAFLTGLIGAAFFSVLLGIAIEALVMTGIWGLLKKGLSGETIRRGETFWASLLERFPDVFSLFLLKAAMRLLSGCLGASLLIGFLRAGSTGALSQLSSVTLTLLIAGSLTFYLAWIALIRLAFEAIGAPLILDEVPLGEAILRGASFIIENFVAVYRLLIFYLGLLLVPMGVYWLLLMGQNLLLLAPDFAILGTILRITGEILLWSSMSVLGVLFYGAIFAFYHCDDAQAPRASDEEGSALQREERPVFYRGTTLQDLLPEKSPHRFSFQETLPQDEKSAQDARQTEEPEEPEND